MRPSTNALVVVAQYQVLATFLAALVILADALGTFGLSDLALGSLLLAANSAIVCLSGVWCVQRLWREQERAAWRGGALDEEQRARMTQAEVHGQHRAHVRVVDGLDRDAALRRPRMKHRPNRGQRPILDEGHEVAVAQRLTHALKPSGPEVLRVVCALR